MERHNEVNGSSDTRDELLSSSITRTTAERWLGCLVPLEEASGAISRPLDWALLKRSLICSFALTSLLVDQSWLRPYEVGQIILWVLLRCKLERRNFRYVKEVTSFSVLEIIFWFDFLYSNREIFFFYFIQGKILIIWNNDFQGGFKRKYRYFNHSDHKVF